jgi:hypothetical protein
LNIFHHASEVLDTIRNSIKSIREKLMFLYRSEICVEVLIESGIAKTIKYLLDYCRLYESDVPELKSLISNCDQIL